MNQDQAKKGSMDEHQRRADLELMEHQKRVEIEQTTRQRHYDAKKSNILPSKESLQQNVYNAYGGAGLKTVSATAQHPTKKLVYKSPTELEDDIYTRRQEQERGPMSHLRASGKMSRLQEILEAERERKKREEKLNEQRRQSGDGQESEMEKERKIIEFLEKEERRKEALRRYEEEQRKKMLLQKV